LVVICSKLVELNANFNQLDSWLPVLGWKLTKLRKLELHFNNLVGLPESFGHMKALKHLDLRNNHLRSLPSSIGMLTQLETMDLSRNFNNLCTLPDSIGELLSLSVLDLSFNQIRELPASLGKLKGLKKLMLDQNPLVVPPKRVIEHSQEAVLAYLLDIYQNGPKPKQSTALQTGRKLSPPGRSPAACLMIPASPRHEHAGGWVPVRPGSTWMRSFFGQFMCGGVGNVMGGNTMRWQEYHSDDEDR
jgi:Leucine-rich repeat (LRR) protein